MTERAVEVAAKVIYETWGGPWAIAPQFRRDQAGREASAILLALKQDPQAAQEAAKYLLEQE